MHILDALKYPLWLAGVAGSTKSFLHNPIIGSPRLNKSGLHMARVRWAARLAAWRRSRLAHNLKAEDREAFDRDGFILKRNYLPEETFKRLLDEVHGNTFRAREMRQGQTVTRMTPLTTRSLAPVPATRSMVRDEYLRHMVQYVASYGGEPLFFLQTVIADPTREKNDPQTDLHSDTFHSTAKAWLFLHDVGEDEGPFRYVPGSHRADDVRLQWEYENSLTARDDPRHHHALGSFRIRQDELASLGLPQPMPVAVPANTLVIADTYGFHGRTPSKKPTTRLEVHGHLRRNPFLLWNGLHVMSLPGIKGRELDIFLAYSDFIERKFGKRTIWRPVGEIAPDAPAQI